MTSRTVCPAPRIAIVDTAATGHHVNEIDLVTRAVLEEGFSPILFVDFDAAERLMGNGKSLLKGTVQVHTIPRRAQKPANGPFQGLASQFSERQSLEEIYKSSISKCDCNMIYMINLDPIEKALAICGSPFSETPFMGMIMRTWFHHRECGVKSPRTFREFLDETSLRRLLRLPTLRKILSNDELLPSYCTRHGWDPRNKLTYIPDYAPLGCRLSRDAARKQLGISPSAVVILAYGAMSPRKSLDLLLEAAAAVPCSELVVLIAGECDASAREQLRSATADGLRARGRLLEIAGFQDVAGEARAFGASDLVWVGYRSFYQMSGVLVQAAHANLPVLSTDAGMIGYYTAKCGLGMTADMEDLRAVTAALRLFVSRAWKQENFGHGCEAFARKHSFHSCFTAIRSAIRATLKSA
jgi:glycosyltransferase involved in cell wall biosynthesis